MAELFKEGLCELVMKYKHNTMSENCCRTAGRRSDGSSMWAGRQGWRRPAWSHPQVDTQADIKDEDAVTATLLWLHCEFAEV